MGHRNWVLSQPDEKESWCETVSVVIPAHNRAELVREAIDSVLSQTTPANEIIVVDDGSTDSTRDVVRSYGHRVVLLTQPHDGASAARNRGVAYASGEWVGFLDSDDVWTPTKLEEQLRFLRQHPDCDLVHTGFYRSGERTGVPEPSPRFLSGAYVIEGLLFAEDSICTSSVIVRRRAAVPFREWAARSQDILFFADLLKAGTRFGYVDESLVGRRIHPGCVNRLPGSQVLGTESQWRWVRETFATQSESRRRLGGNLFGKVVTAMSSAKWRRDWATYWEWRGWLVANWPADLPRPPALTERIYPPFVYRLKDRCERLLPAGRRCRVRAAQMVDSSALAEIDLSPTQPPALRQH